MYESGYESSLNVSRQIQIGRVSIDVIQAELDILWSWERGDGDASFVLALPLDGRAIFSQEGRSGLARVGEYVLLSEAASCEMSLEEGSRMLLVRIPSVELRGRLVAIDDHVSRRFKANENMGRLLSDLFKNIANLFADRAPPNPQALATEVIGFVALTIGAEDRGAATDVRNARYYLRRRIIEFIERHLSDQDLSPKKIAANSRISLSYLYSLFNDDETTVGQFVQAKRLQRAYEILVADPRGHRTVSEIAYEVGFKNVSHFSRTFSRRFNMAPRDVRQRGRSQYVETATATSASARSVSTPDNVPARNGLGSFYWKVNKQRPVHERV